MFKNILRLVVISMLSLVVFSSNTYASSSKGQKIVIKKLKKDCGFDGGKLALKHTQDEWSDIIKDGNLGAEIKKICPKSKPLKLKYIGHVGDFLFEYASDSGNVPSC